MDSTMRTLLVSADVMDAITEALTGTKVSVTDKFADDLKFNLGSFEALLTVICNKLNSDSALHLMAKIRWQDIPPDPKSRQTFPEAFLNRTVSDLITAFDAGLSHSPFSRA